MKRCGSVNIAITKSNWDEFRPKTKQKTCYQASKVFTWSSSLFGNWQQLSQFNECISLASNFEACQIALHKVEVRLSLLKITRLKKLTKLVWPHFTEVRFASFLSGGFTTMAVINPPDCKLANQTSVKWRQRTTRQQDKKATTSKRLCSRRAA